MENKKYQQGVKTIGWLLMLYGLFSFCGMPIIVALFSAFSLALPLMHIGMGLPLQPVALGIFISGIGVLRCKRWGKRLAVGVLLCDISIKFLGIFSAAMLNKDMFSFLPEAVTLATATFYLSFLLDLTALFCFTRSKIKEQFK